MSPTQSGKANTNLRALSRLAYGQSKSSICKCPLLGVPTSLMGVSPIRSLMFVRPDMEVSPTRRQLRKHRPMVSVSTSLRAFETLRCESVPCLKSLICCKDFPSQNPIKFACIVMGLPSLEEDSINSLIPHCQPTVLKTENQHSERAHSKNQW